MSRFFDQEVSAAWCVYGAEHCTLGLGAGQTSVLTFMVVFLLTSYCRGHSLGSLLVIPSNSY